MRRASWRKKVSPGGKQNLGGGAVAHTLGQSTELVLWSKVPPCLSWGYCKSHIAIFWLLLSRFAPLNHLASQQPGWSCRHIRKGRSFPFRKHPILCHLTLQASVLTSTISIIICCIYYHITYYIIYLFPSYIAYLQNSNYTQRWGRWAGPGPLPA